MDTQRLVPGVDGPVGELDGLPQPAPAPRWLAPLLRAAGRLRTRGEGVR